MASAFFHRAYARFDSPGLRAVFAPRKPRNPLLRLVLGLVGLALLAVLLVVGLFVGAAMVSFGLLRQARRRGKAAREAGVLDADYRVVPKTGQPLLR